MKETKLAGVAEQACKTTRIGLELECENMKKNGANRTTSRSKVTEEGELPTVKMVSNSKMWSMSKMGMKRTKGRTMWCQPWSSIHECGT